MNAQQLFSAGELGQAVAVATEEVKRKPTDLAARSLLAELLCFAGDFERADKQLDALAQQDLASAVSVSVFRQLLRAETARQQCFAEGRVPEFLAPIPPHLKSHLEACLHLREGRLREAADAIRQAEESRPAVAGTCDGRPFEGLRDMDDLTASFWEVLTTTGKYYWIPMERVERIEFHAPARPRDLLWRRVQMSVHDGPDGEVFLPVLYPSSAQETEDRFRLGRMTDWRGGEGAPVRGLGQRMLLVGDEDRSLMELHELVGEIPGSGAADVANSAG